MEQSGASLHKTEQMALLGQPVHKDQQVLMEQRDHKVHKVLPEQQVQQELQEQMVKTH
jgi:hypothetical protein